MRGERKKKFTYRDIKTVYTIVFFEKSTQEFHLIKEHYIHKSKQVFDTKLESVQYMIEEQEKVIKEQAEELERKSGEISQKEQQIVRKELLLNEKAEEIAELRRKLEELSGK